MSVTVPPQATIESRHATLRRASPDTVEYAARIVVRANGSYRLIARRAAPAGYPIAILREGQPTTRLDQGRQAVQVARGESGVANFEVRYLVACMPAAGVCAAPESASALIAFEVMVDPSGIW